MKKHTFLSLLMAFAMIFTFVGFTACGDDDPDPAPNPGPNPGGNTDAKVTSGTLYVLEGYLASTFDWVNYQTSIEKDGNADNYVTVTADGLSSAENLNFVTGEAKAALDLAIKTTYGTVNYAPSFRVTSKTVSSFPTTFSIKHQGTVKEGLSEKQNFGYGEIYLFVDNNGKPYTASSKAQYGQGIKVDRAQEFVTRVLDAYSKNVTVSFNGDQVTVK